MTTRKKSDAEALQWMREVCLALPDTSEGVHYGEIMFKAGKNGFASCGDKRGPMMIVLGLEPEHTQQVLAQNSKWQRYPYEKRAIMIKASDIDDWDEIRAFVAESHRVHGTRAPKARTAPNRASSTTKATKAKHAPRRK